MNKLQIIINKNNLMVSSLQSVSTTIYVQNSDFAFPSDQWIDLSVSVLSMWIPTLNRHLLDLQPCATLFFMDGDYSIQLEKISERESIALFINTNGEIIYRETIDLLYFARQALAASAKLIHGLPTDTASQYTAELIEFSHQLRSTIREIVTK